MGADSPKISLAAKSQDAINVFNKMAKGIGEKEKFEEDPSYIVTRNISSKSGKLATKLSDYAGASYTEKFICGTEPKDHDDLFKKYLICKDSGKLANQFCPSESVLYTVLFERKEGYDPKDHYGIYPEDYMTIPKSYCNIHTREWYNEHSDESDSKSDKSSSKKKDKSAKKSIDKAKTSSKKRK